MPMGFLLYLKRYKTRGVLATNQKLIFRVGFLYSGYADKFWWWESIVVIRKILIITLITL